MSKPDPRRSYKAGVSNNLGHVFEDAVKKGCTVYLQRGKAMIDKTPEPFMVKQKKQDGIFVGRFTAHAQPDFQGTLAGGRSIIFETKYTTTERAKRDMLTPTQAAILEMHDSLGALAAVCVGIHGKGYFFVPWPVWRDMKKTFGRVTLTAEDLEPFRVKFNGAVLFLDYVHYAGGRWIDGTDCEIRKWREK